MIQRTFVMIKPDGVMRGLVGEVIQRIERKGLKVVAMKMMNVSREMAEEHYKEHVGKSFYEKLINYITSGPVVAMVVEGDEAVDVVRRIIGKTDPKEALPGTIRGDLAMDIGRNVVHGSDSEESAYREISLFFSDDEILSYDRVDEKWVYEGRP